MGDVRIRAFVESDRAAVIELWSACDLVRSWNDPDRDIDRKLADSPELLLVANERERLVGTVMAGYDGHRGWINYLAVDPARRRAGLGRRLVDEAVRLLAERGCAKVNLQIREGNDAAVAFYERLGFGIDPVVSMGKRLVSDEPA